MTDIHSLEVEPGIRLRVAMEFPLNATAAA